MKIFLTPTSMLNDMLYILISLPINVVVVVNVVSLTEGIKAIEFHVLGLTNLLGVTNVRHENIPNTYCMLNDMFYILISLPINVVPSQKVSMMWSFMSWG